MAEVKPKRKKLAIIDGKSVFYRGYYAMPNLSTKDGVPTGGVYGFAVMALEVLKKLEPDYIAVAWDKPKTNIRKRLELYPEYKAGRKPAPDDFKVQIPLLHELLAAFGWPLYELDDYEADDIMGTLAVQATKKNIETQLITSDLDVLQLIDYHVSVYAIKKGFSNIELFQPASFTQKYGLQPNQFLDLKALKGDSSDNIPGVPGVGEKTATELLKEYKTLDEIYDNLALVKDSVRLKLEAGRDLAYLSKKIGAIWTDAPMKLNLAEVDGSKCEPRKVQGVLERLEFRTLVRQLPEAMRLPEEVLASKPTKLQIGTTVNINNAEQLDKLSLPKTEELVIIAASTEPHGRVPVSLTLSPGPRTVITLDLTTLDNGGVTSKVKKYIEDINLVGYDLKSSLQTLRTLGIYPRNVKHDVQIGAFLINPLRRVISLEELAAEELNIHLSEEDKEPSAVVSIVRTLHEGQAKELSKLPGVTKLAKDVEWPIIPVLADMEYEGIKLDTSYLNLMSAQVTDMISDLEQQIYGFADQEFNVASPSQLADILFNKLGLPTEGIKRGKTGYSTAASELEKLRGKHEVVDLIGQFREVTKLKNTYIDTLPQQTDDSSRVHTSFSLTIAPTGRLSSSDPNLQNIPVKTELGKRIRTAFVAEEGYTLISADYSQFELRLAAVLSKDEDMTKLFNEDADIHRITAAEIYNRSPEDVTKSMRRVAKVVNFGIMYGLGPHGLTVATGLTYEQAKHFIDRYFEIRPKLLKYIEAVRTQAKEKGYVETLFGRRRPSPDVNSANFAVREAAYRAAVNMPFQGTAADIMKMAMIEVDKKLKDNCRLLLQIHDSIIVEVPEAAAKSTAKMIKDTMEGVVKLPVKLTVDTTTGQNWGEL